MFYPKNDIIQSYTKKGNQKIVRDIGTVSSKRLYNYLTPLCQIIIHTVNADGGEL